MRFRRLASSAELLVVNRWEQMASESGGSVAGLATAIGGTGQMLVFAATSVGVYCSADDGLSWKLPGIGRSVPFAESVTPSPRFDRDGTLFVCAGDGLYRSTDRGRTWQQILVGSRMLSVACAQRNAGERLVVLAGTETDGVLLSEDGGHSWAGVNAGVLDLSAMALALSPRFDADRTGFIGTASGLYRTRNGARSWREVGTGLDAPAVQCLAMSPTFAEDRLVLAGTEADGLLRSTDAGASWHQPPSLRSRSVTALAFSSGYGQRGSSTIAASTESGIAVSHDAGASWRATGSAPSPVLSLTLVRRADGETLLAGVHRQGLWCSADEGASWQPANAGLNLGLLTAMVFSPAFADDRTMFAAGLEEGVSVSEDAGRTWAQRSEGLDDLPVVGLAVSNEFATNATLYAATPTGLHVSRDRGRGWQQLTADGRARAVAVLPRAGMVPETILVALAGGALLTIQEGVSDTPRAQRDRFGGAAIIALEVSPSYAQDQTIFVATSGVSPGSGGEAQVVLWRSVDGGQRWQRWLVEHGGRTGAGAASDVVAALALSPGYALDEGVFVGLGRRVLRPMRNAREVRSGERRPLWLHADLGDEALALTALAMSPNYATERTLFAATSAGVFVSRNAGETFQPWSEGLSQPRMVALKTSPDYAADRLVYSVSLGGTIWRRRDGSQTD